jgi:hypothetical protein
MEQAASAQPQNYNNSSISPCTSHRSTYIVLDKTEEIPRVVDI